MQKRAFFASFTHVLREKDSKTHIILSVISDAVSYCFEKTNPGYSNLQGMPFILVVAWHQRTHLALGAGSF